MEGREGGKKRGGGERMDAGYHTLQTSNYSTLGAPTWMECGWKTSSSLVPALHPNACVPYAVKKGILNPLVA